MSQTGCDFVKSLKQFEKRPMPHWGGDMSEIYFDDIYYYINQVKLSSTSGKMSLNQSKIPKRS